MDYPAISIVVLNHNGLGYLRRTIPSLLKLGYKNYELIVVDNGSSDESLKYLMDNKRIKVIANDVNLGTSGGRNLGAKKCEGEYIFFLDNDILITDNNILSELICFYSKLKRPAFVNVVLIDSEDLDKKKTIYYGGYYGLFGIKINKKLGYEKLRKMEFLETANCFTGALFVRREVWNKLGGFDESQLFNLDDDDISLRAKIFGFSNYTYTRSYFIHLGKNRRVDNNIFRWKYKYYFSGKAIPLFKNFYWRSALIIFPFYFILTVIKTAKNSLFRRDPKLWFSFGYSIFIFLKSFPETLKKRKVIQKKRAVSDNKIFCLKCSIK